MPTISPAELQGVELLAGFSPEELQLLSAHLVSREFAANDAVFSAGDAGRSLYLILSGRVKIELIGDLVAETELAEPGPGEVFGESNFFHAAPHIITARCTEATRVAELPYAAYELLLKSNSAMAYHLGANAAHILAARLQATDNWVREVLEYDEQMLRRKVREQYISHFQPSFTTPHGFVGIGTNW